MKDPKATYCEFLMTAFEKIKRSINTRKLKELKDLCTSASEQVPLDTLPDANKYFPIFKQALDTQNTRVVEVTLYFLQKLLAHGFLTGNCADNCRPAGTVTAPTRLPRQLIDTIIESICACVQERDDNVQLQVIKTLLTAVTSFSCAVHDRILLEAFRACYHIYLTSKNQVNQTTAKATLTQMLHTVCQRMESAVVKHEGPKDEGLDAMLKTMVKHVVDDVVLHTAKVAKAPEVDHPLRTVPAVLNPEDPLYKTISVAEAENEDNVAAGKFGWCANCRRAADLYCKDTRMPVCSAECKDAQLKLIEKVNTLLAGQEEINEYMNDAVIIFRSICKLSNKEIPNSLPSFTLRSKVLSLDLILAVVDNPGPVLSSRKEFIEIIRSILCESLVANSLNSEKTIFTLSLSIFVALVNNFKEKLKMEVGIFLEQVLVRILASENSSFNHKLLVLQVFFRITSNPKLTVELFLNYDCDLDERDIFSRMIDMLAKIGQGKYSKTEALLPPQESALRLTALETLVNIMTSLVAWMDTDPIQRDSTVQSDDTSEESSSLLETTTIIEPDRFEQQKLLKSLLSKAVAKFNIKPSLAIRYLASCRQLDPQNAKEIAVFLKNTAGLNKTKIGEYLGKADPESKAVLHDFVFMQDYREMELLPALRTFLNTFRLPGEGQQVDRLMEKFSEKYCIDNPSAFETADTAFVLLYSIIMLQTDANNPGVKKKMTFEDYLKITRGINNGKDLPREFLEDIFTSIKTNPITLKDDEELLMRLEGSGKRKDEMFEKESQFILAVSKESMGKARRSEFVENATIDYIKPLFESVWHALLAAFSVVLEESQEPQTYHLALAGVLSCIRIAAKFAMHLELEGFVSCLSKFTSLLLLKEEMTQKNVECVKTLIYAAKLEANALRSSWGHVLRCVSKLDYLHLVSEGSRGDMFLGSQARRPEIAGAEEVFSSIKMQDIDYLFSISSSLDNEAIVEFVEQLVLVSHEEIWSEQPRIFSLQALVTVADVNMNRIRLVWGKIWACLKAHFSHAGLHHNQYIAMFAIDSLKQLAIKFLQKEELSNFRFQKEFLQPFTSILKETTSQAVKELVVDCMTNLVLTLAANIKSGWQCIVDVFLTATLDEVLLQKIFPALVKIAESEMDKVLEQFGEMLNCVMNCAISSKEEIALKALDLTIHCAEVLSKGKVDVSSHWHVLLVRLAEKLSDVRPSVQQRATSVLFSILEKQTEGFGEEQWRMVMAEVMIPLFDDASFSTKLNPDWLKTFHQLQLGFVDIMASKYAQLAFLLPEYLTSLHNCVKAGVESTAKSAVSALKSLALKLAPQLPSSTWQLLCSLITDLFKSTAPSELLACPIDTLLKERKEALPFSTEACVSKCVIQLQLLSLVKEMLEGQFTLIPTELVMGLLTAVKESHAFAVSFNEQILRRYGLWRSGFMGDLKTLPGLNRQQTSSLTLYLTFSFKLLEDCEDIKSDLISMCKLVISSYTSKETRTPKEGDILVQLENASIEQELTLLRPIVSQSLVTGITQSKHFRSLVSELKEELLSLVVSSSLEVREALKRLLLLVVA